MSFKSTFTAVLTASILMTSSAFADGFMVKDAYARSARPNAPTGAAFMMLMNTTDTDVKIIGVRSEVAKRVELHTHIDKGEGVMQMTQIEGGISIPAGESHMLKRGGDHVMLMGLNDSLVDGETITITFEFENAGDLIVEIPIDSARKPAKKMDH
ncbi:MAG: copper(I)-binding protein [Ascidiaceihabitans sp.]|jgi:copper(I)-binding protein|tara:strand:+ start:207 stop:671 length:465 start_codon:yes stop_codon:yes gene_type:complete